VRKRRLFLVIAMVATTMIFMPQAKACSCAPSDPRDVLHSSDGAFIGTYVSREPSDPTDPYSDHDYIFETEDVIKGEIGDVIQVRAPENGASCGLEYPPGARAAMFLTKEGELWTSHLCSTVHPDVLTEAAAPFPDPDAEGPPRFLVGGSFGEVRVIALDRQGRTAGYGYGDGDALFMSRCPGGESAAELVGAFFASAPISVDVRRFSDLMVTETTPGPARWDEQFVFPLAARCISSDGDTVAFVRGFGETDAFTELVLFSDEGVSTIDERGAASAALGRDAAYIGDGRRIVVADYSDGGTTTLRTMNRKVSHLAVSPDGRFLVGITGATYQTTDPMARMFLLRTSDGSLVEERKVGASDPESGAIEWLTARRFLYSGGSTAALVMNQELGTIARVRNWFSASSNAIGCDLYGAGHGAVVKASACRRSESELVRAFFSPITPAFLKLPVGTEVNAPPQP
jgi:hypothetical protein